jgi:uncharacterized membrane protein (UPF0127 family)
MRGLPCLSVCLLLAFAPACRAGETGPHASSEPVAPRAQPRTPTAPSTVEVVVQTPSGNRLRVQAEVARTDAERSRGLMFRKKLAQDAGMLFVMPGDDDWAFWMKNTLLPLDLVFADKDGLVVGVVENARPLDETSRRAGKPSRHVLEVNGGWCSRNGVGVGARMMVPEGL